MDDVAKGCATCRHARVFLFDEPCDSCKGNLIINKEPTNWEPEREEVKNENGRVRTNEIL